MNQGAALSEATFFFASALFPLQLAAQPPMTLRGPVEQSEKEGRGSLFQNNTNTH
jgi:hypothetical protein